MKEVLSYMNNILMAYGHAEMKYVKSLSSIVETIKSSDIKLNKKEMLAWQKQLDFPGQHINKQSRSPDLKKLKTVKEMQPLEMIHYLGSCTSNLSETQNFGQRVGYG